MEVISSLLNSLAVILPVVAVVTGAILTYVYGFKQPVEPKFKKSSSEGSKKLRKKEKVTTITLMHVLQLIINYISVTK